VEVSEENQKTGTNKKKYSNKINYKLVASGKKYKVYKRAYPFRLKATVKKLSYAFEGEYGKSYGIAVRAYSGKKAGAYSKIKSVIIPEKAVEPEQSNVNIVLGYAEKLYNENMTADRDYINGGFTWDQEFVRSKSKNPDATTYAWKYYNALMLEAFLTEGRDDVTEILRFYDSHFNEDGELLIEHDRLYPGGTVDTAMPAAVMIKLVSMGAADERQTADYNRAANTVYNKLENQYVYDGLEGRPYAGKLFMHHQKKDLETGEIVPVSAWSKWPVCLDGIYMSQLFLIRLAEAIDAGKMTITANDGHVVTSEELWEDIYERLNYVATELRIKETGLLPHVYSLERGESNNISWSRGTGWFMMVMLEACDKMPDGQKKQQLQAEFDSLLRSVLEWQDPESHLWYNVMTRRDDLAKNRPETSGSAMLTYCLLKGYHDGILKDEEFRNAGITAFNAMVKYHYTEIEGLADTLISMGPASKETDYQNPQFVSNEAKGVAPLIMAAKYVLP
jgi:rhamnogalacturonyl hydrolase YesR